MTTVPPPTTVVTPPANTQAPSAPIVALLQAAANVTAQPPGTVLQGVVVQDAQTATNGTAVTIRTADGNVTIQLPQPLPTGAQVALQTLRAAQTASQDASTITQPQTQSTPQATVLTSAQTAIRLLSVDDQPASQVLAQMRQSAPIQAASPDPAEEILANALQDDAATGGPALSRLPLANAWTPQGPVALMNLGTVSAYVIEAPSGTVAATPSPTNAAPAAPAAQSLGFPPGSELSIRVTSIVIAPPSTSPSEPVTAQSPAASPAQQPASTAPATAAPVPDASQTVLVQNAGTATPRVVVVPDEALDTQDDGTADAEADLPANQTGPAPSTPTAPTPMPVQPAVLLATPDGPVAIPPAPPTNVQTPQPEAVVTGVVVSSGPTAPPVIATDMGPIQLNVFANLPVGARVTLEIAAHLPPEPGAVPVPPTATTPLAGPPAQFAGTNTGWPTLTQAMQMLGRADPAAAAQLAELIPDGGPRTVLALVAFVEAMRGGDSRSWPGDTTLRALERLGPRGAQVARQLGQEVSAMSDRARSAGAEWRPLPILWNADGRIDRIALITRREETEDGETNKKGGGKGGQRFLVNVDLSRLGALQLDGMFRKENRGFDMIVRSQTALSETIRQDLTGLFAASNAAMGLKGALTFQVVRKLPDPVGDGQQWVAKPGLWA